MMTLLLLQLLLGLPPPLLRLATTGSVVATMASRCIQQHQRQQQQVLGRDSGRQSLVCITPRAHSSSRSSSSLLNPLLQLQGRWSSSSGRGYACGSGGQIKLSMQQQLLLLKHQAADRSARGGGTPGSSSNRCRCNAAADLLLNEPGPSWQTMQWLRGSRLT